jgi:Alginate export
MMRHTCRSITAACSLIVPISIANANIASIDWGGEYRLKFESLEPGAFDLGPYGAQDIAGQRLLAHLLVAVPDSVKAFVELGVYDDSGREPSARPIDQGALDVAQAYIQVPWHGWSAKIGRQNVAFTRLIATRDASNVRRSFDLARLDSPPGRWHGVMMFGKPVRAQFGSFDDDHEPREIFRAAALSHSLDAEGTRSWDLFYIGRERQVRIPGNPVAIEHRHNVGARWLSRGTRCTLELQASIQGGNVKDHSIDAQGFASDWSCAIRDQGAWRIGTRLDFASGDRDPLDDSNDTFDPLYPNLSYFTDAPVLYPGNDFDIHPYLAFAPQASFTLNLGADFLFRARAEDANYQPPGFVLVGPQQGSSGDHITTLAYCRGSWKPQTNLDVTIAYVYGFAGAVIARAGGHDMRYAMLQLSIRR